ncbi:MAG: hypothetical protein K6G28_05680, partial [Acholeplasmatales bacterium]|nr:hypothetical protein [Acholeplasmatales bacterium]
SIVMITKFNGYQELYTSVKVEANIIKVSNNKIHARGKSISIYIKLATSYYKPNPRHYILSSLAKKYDLKNINEAAVSKYKSLYYTQSIHTNNYNINNTYNFSRYIMISSSLYNLPMTRNGIWSFNNDDTYNLGAFLTNYSNCFGGNLKDCINPLFDFLKLIHKTGKSPARKMYKARGSFSFNNFDMFGNTFLKGDNLNISYNPLGQTNLVPFILDYYRYSNDLNFVKHYYSLIKDNVDFVISNLKKDKNNKYVFYPSTSIGDTFKIDNELCYISDGCTSDDIFIYELMYDFILINRDLGYDEAINKPYVDIILNMHHIGINNKNYIMPYHSDYKVARPSYTLLTHVTNVFSKDYKPTSVVTDANKNTILKMEDYKNDGSLRASLTHFYANLGMKKEFYESFNKFIDNNVSDSLLSLDSDVNLMGNFQIGKAIHDAFIIPKFFKLYLNQSLPKDITNYSLKGFPVYNNIVVDLIKTDNEFVINYKSKDYYVNLKTGSNRIDLNELFNLN